MSGNTVLILCLIAIIASIAICFKTNINMGLIAMSFAFIIGCLFCGEKAATIFGYWPDSLIFFLIASAMFYGFARENGTLTLFGTKLLYKFRKSTNAIPFVFALIAFILGLLGAGPGTIVLLAPLGYSVCAQIGIDPLLMVFAIDTGYNCGTQNPWTGSGVVLYGLLEESGLAADLAISTYMLSYATFLINKVFFLILFYVVFKFLKKKQGNSAECAAKNLEILNKEPEAFSPIQKKTMALIVVSFCLLVIPNIANTLFHFKNPVFKNLVALCKPQAVLIIFALIACFMKIGEPKKVINKLPMGTVLTIAGVCFLMEIAKKNGLLDTVVAVFQNGTIPTFLIAPVFCFIAAFLSIFASGTSVVLPLLFPMVPALAAATGVNMVALYAAAQIGALATPISPFSTAGAQFVGLAPDDKLSETLVKQQFILAMIMMVATSIAAMLGLCNIFKI